MSVIKKMVLMSMLLSLVACGQSNSEKFMQAAVRAELKDPDSAKWGNTFTYKNRGCLEVNSKNSFGGYTGTHVAWMKNLGSDNTWMVEKVEEGRCYEQALKDLAAIDEAGVVIETKILGLLASKGYKITLLELLSINNEDQAADKCLLQAKHALTSKQIALSSKGDEQAEWQSKYEKELETVVSDSCKA